MASSEDGKVKLIVFAIGLLLVLVCTLPFRLNYNTVTVTVDSKERIVSSTGTSSYYLVYTDNEVFTNQDDYINFKFNSSDVYNKLKEGRTYEVTVVGYRVPFMSWYRNILRAEEVR